jgi:hypothetical protein
MELTQASGVRLPQGAIEPLGDTARQITGGSKEAVPSTPLQEIDFVVVESTEETFSQEPKEGWKLQAFHYYTEHQEGNGYGKAACVFLAEDADGEKKGVQWWMHNDPTVFHGDWNQGLSTLVIRFNARGPLHDDGSRRALKGAYLQNRPASEEHVTTFYEGYDACRRLVKMVPYGTWAMKKEGEHLVWADVRQG